MIDLKSGSEEEITYSGFSIAGDPYDQNMIYLGTNVDIYGIKYSNGKWYQTLIIEHLPQEQRTIVVDKYNFLWSGSINGGVTKYNLSEERDSSFQRLYTKKHGLPANQRNQVYLDPDSEDVLFGTVNGFYRYDYLNDTIFRDTIITNICTGRLYARFVQGLPSLYPFKELLISKCPKYVILLTY